MTIILPDQRVTVLRVELSIIYLRGTLRVAAAIQSET